jgi:hypothetical protein
MRRYPLICLAALLVLIPTNFAWAASTMTDRLSGRILLQVESHGEAWYVDPVDLKRHYLGRPADAFDIMRSLGLGITDDDLKKIPEAGGTSSGDAALTARLSGRILLQVESHGEAWYVDPVDLKRHYLGRPTDAFNLMRSLGLGISDSDISLIEASGALPPPDEYRSYRVSTEKGQFDVLTLTMPRATYRPLTLTAQPSDCAADCPAKPLADYVAAAGAVAGIHGSYFCPPDYNDCSAKVNSFLWPVFDSVGGKMVNEVNLKYHERPLVVVDDSGDPHLYRNAKTDFGWSLVEYESRVGRRVAAALGNYPALMQDGTVVVESESTLDTNQQTAKTNRGGWGWDANNYYIVVAKQAAVVDLAYVFKSLGATDAMNLDGGGTTALWYGGGYKIGPGRQLPNAVVFVKK